MNLLPPSRAKETPPLVRRFFGNMATGFAGGFYFVSIWVHGRNPFAQKLTAIREKGFADTTFEL